MLEAPLGLAIKTPKTLSLDLHSYQLGAIRLGHLACLANRLSPVALLPSDRESTTHHAATLKNSYSLPLHEHLICEQCHFPAH